MKAVMRTDTTHELAELFRIINPSIVRSTLACCRKAGLHCWPQLRVAAKGTLHEVSLIKKLTTERPVIQVEIVRVVPFWEEVGIATICARPFDHVQWPTAPCHGFAAARSRSPQRIGDYFAERDQEEEHPEHLTAVRC